MLDDRKNWEEWLAKGPQDYKPARRERKYYAIGGGIMGLFIHAIVASIPQRAWRQFGWQRAFIIIGLLFSLGLLAKGVDKWHYGMIERNHYYSMGMSEQYPAEYAPVAEFNLFGTFTFPREPSMHVIPSDALAHQIFSWAAAIAFWLAGVGTFLVIWLFWKYPDAFKEGDFRDDEVTFGPKDPVKIDPLFDPLDNRKRAGYSSEPMKPPHSPPPQNYTGFGRAKTIEVPRDKPK